MNLCSGEETVLLSPVSHSSKVIETEKGGVMGTSDLYLVSLPARSTSDNLDLRLASEGVGVCVGVKQNKMFPQIAPLS